MNATSLRAWALPWLVAALAVRLFFAPGLMPGRDANGPAITICSGMADHAGDPTGAPTKPCPYEALGTPALAAHAPLPTAPIRTEFPFAQRAVARARAVPARRAPAPPARAPPQGMMIALYTA